MPLASLPPSFQTPYHVWVRRGWESIKVEIYRVPLQERLPVIRIPLRQTETDVALDLQALIDECYRNGDYENDLNYQVEPQPPLGPDAVGSPPEPVLNQTSYAAL